MHQKWQQMVISQQADGPALSNSNAATSILLGQAKFLFPANFWEFVGMGLHVYAAGRLSNIVTTPGTLTLDLRLGGTVVFNGGAMQLSTTAHTNVPWEWSVNLTLRATGTTGNFIGQGNMTSQAINISGADPTTGHSTLETPNTNPAVGNNVDLTAALALDLFATFSIANSANLIQTTQFKLISE